MLAAISCSDGLSCTRAFGAAMNLRGAMRRREVMTLLGGVVAWPRAARAQQPKLPTIGFLGTSTPLNWNPVDRGLRAAAARTWLDRGPHRRYRVSIGGGTQRALPRDRRRVSASMSISSSRGPRSRQRSRPHRPSRSYLRLWSTRSAQASSLAWCVRPGNVTGSSGQSVEIAGKRLKILHEFLPGSATNGDHRQCRL